LVVTGLLLLVLVQLPTTPLPATDGATYALAAEVARHDFTVVLFFSRECPVQRSHDARLLEVVHDFASKGVAWVAVDAQVDASLEKDREAARARGYPFPIVVDPEGTWADALTVRFSTTLVVLDAKGRVRYRGGLDDDRVKLSSDVTPLARRALERLVTGQEPERVETKALGCVLRRK
jgi:peroxiredoxin